MCLAEPCDTTVHCAQQSVDAADRAEKAVKALMDKIDQMALVIEAPSETMESVLNSSAA